MAKPLPTHADLIDYNQGVAGHDGTLSDVDGELFIKPCTPAEIAFYDASVAYHQDFADFMPAYMGTLTLDHHPNGTTIEEAGAALLAKHARAVEHYEHHNGTTIEASGLAAFERNEEALDIAEAVMIAKHSIPEYVTPAKTTKKIVTDQAVVLENAAHGFIKPNILDVKLGVRLWADDAKEEKRIRFDKVTAETTHKDLGFRIAGMRVWHGEGAKGQDIDKDGFKIFGKNYGRVVQTSNIEDAFRNFLFSPAAGVDEELGKLVTQAFLVEVKRIQALMEGQESRMFSSSLLFIFEGDGVALRKAMEEASRSPPTLVNGDEDNSDDENEIIDAKIYTVKIIDFAHAEWTPGRGPDENSLIGVRSVARILEKIGSA
ncbi:related to transcriptional regulator ARG82 [Rhynchosporium secalis]|uniref:Kinase n=1 Tax=Rhynchosporium secalis TaxID=38038 RepID=A0A1E1M9Y8_RHYSE|nr:related to transcriptional regulator ARG82 [Rhynchosporium secalis]